MNDNTKENRKALKILIQQAKSVEKTMNQILVLVGENNIGFKYSSCNDFVRHYHAIVEEAKKYIRLPGIYNLYDVTKLKNIFDMTGIEQMVLFQSVLVSIRLLISTLEENYDYVADELNSLENFISSKFRLMFNNIPNDEREIQDNLERLFIGNGMNKGVDYDRETGKFNFSSREYIPDFIIPNLNCCLEVKFLKDKSKKSKIIEEINADITAYSKEYSELLFLVYDLGVINDVTEFKRDIESSGNVKVIVIKH